MKKLFFSQFTIGPFQNLFRLKGSLGPRLDDANTLQHGTSYWRIATCSMQLCIGSETIKGNAGGSVSLSRLHPVMEATSPVRNKKRRTSVPHGPDRIRLLGKPPAAQHS
jgi:hypothetical protein